MSDEEDDFGDATTVELAAKWEPAQDQTRPTNEYDQFLQNRDALEGKLAVAKAESKALDRSRQVLAIRDIKHNMINEGLDRMAPLPDFAEYSSREGRVKPENAVDAGAKWKEQDPVFVPFYRPPGVFPNNIIPELTNVVATASLACEVDLRGAAVKLPNCEYDPRIRPGLVLRIRNPPVTCVLHATGRMKVLGSKTEYDSRHAVRRFARKLQKAAYLSPGIVRGLIKISKFRVQNIAATVDIGFSISSMERFAAEFDNDALYEPEIASYIKVSSDSPRLTMQIYASGKIVFLGARHRSDIYEAFRQWYPRLQQFKATKHEGYDPKRYNIGARFEPGFAEDVEPQLVKMEPQLVKAEPQQRQFVRTEPLPYAGANQFAPTHAQQFVRPEPLPYASDNQFAPTHVQQFARVDTQRSCPAVPSLMTHTHQQIASSQQFQPPDVQDLLRQVLADPRVPPQYVQTLTQHGITQESQIQYLEQLARHLAANPRQN